MRKFIVFTVAGMISAVGSLGANASVAPVIKKLNAISVPLWNGEDAIVIGDREGDVTVLAGIPKQIVYSSEYCNAGGGFFESFGKLDWNQGKWRLEMKQCRTANGQGRPRPECHRAWLVCGSGKCATVNDNGLTLECR